MWADCELYNSLGETPADVAGVGLAESGNALDLLWSAFAGQLAFSLCLVSSGNSSPSSIIVPVPFPAPSVEWAITHGSMPQPLQLSSARLTLASAQQSMSAFFLLAAISMLQHGMGGQPENAASRLSDHGDFEHSLLPGLSRCAGAQICPARYLASSRWRAQPPLR
jgi:hypothetical protein